MQGDGSVRSAGGSISVYEPPSGRGVRVDGYGYAGYRTNPRYDSLLAKVIVHTPGDDFAQAAAKAERALAEFRISGVASNIPFLRALLKEQAVLNGGMPVGVQLMGQPHEDERITALARWLAGAMAPVVV